MQDHRLRLHIRAAHQRSRKTYGAPRVLRELQDQGLRTSRKRVARLMKLDGLKGRPQKRRTRTTVCAQTAPAAPNLLNRTFHSPAPNQVWMADITYVWTSAGFLYLSVVLDLFSRKVVGWGLAHHMPTELALGALKMAYERRGGPLGLMHHSDQGSQYTSHAYQSFLKGKQAVASMSRKGQCWDNAVVESFFGTLEQELLNHTRFDNYKQAYAALFDYIEVFYNNQRRHSALGDISPAEFERQYQATRLAEAAKKVA